MKEEVKGDDELRAAFEGADTAADVLRGARGLRARPAVRRRAPARRTSRRSATRRSGRTSSRSRPGSRTRRRSSRRSAATSRPTTTTRRTSRRVRDDLEEAKARGHGGRRGRAARAQLQAALDRSLAMNPLTPDHHFYIDQGTNARLRLACIAIGRKLAERRRARRRRGRRVPALQRAAPADGRPVARSTRAGARLRPPRRPRGRRRAAPAVVGRHRDRGGARRSRTRRSGASRRSSTRASRRRPARSRASRRRPGVVEGTARYVASLDEFDQVQRGRHPRVPDDQPGVGRAVHQDHAAS